MDTALSNLSSSAVGSLDGGLIFPVGSILTPYPGISTSSSDKSFATEILPLSNATTELSKLTLPRNSVPLTPMVATGVSTLTFSGLLVAIFPEIKRNVPLVTLTPILSFSPP